MNITNKVSVPFISLFIFSAVALLTLNCCSSIPDDAFILKDNEVLVIHDHVYIGDHQSETYWEHHFENSDTTVQGYIYLRTADESTGRTEATFLYAKFPYQSTTGYYSIEITKSTPEKMTNVELNDATVPSNPGGWASLDYMKCVGTIVIDAKRYYKYWEQAESIWVAKFDSFVIKTTVIDAELAPSFIRPQYKFEKGGVGLPYHMVQDGDYWEVIQK